MKLVITFWENILRMFISCADEQSHGRKDMIDRLSSKTKIVKSLGKPEFEVDSNPGSPFSCFQESSGFGFRNVIAHFKPRSHRVTVLDVPEFPRNMLIQINEKFR